MNADYDVLIIGGGLTGGCLALALQNTPLRVGLLEAVTPAQRESSPAGDRALALAHGTVEILDALRLWDGVKAVATPIKAIHISEQGRFGKTRLAAAKEGVEALGNVITARALESHLAERLLQSAVETFWPARVIGLQAGAESVCLTLKQGDVEKHLSARLVVAADGGNSSVRRLLEIGQNIRDYEQTAIVTQVRPEIHPNFTAYERFTPSGPLALLPVADGCCSVVWTRTPADAEEAMTMAEDCFTASLQACFGYRLGRLTLRAPRRAFPLKLVQAKQMVAPRVALLGNAVHQLHPVAGQGFNLGMRDVAALAERLIQTAAVDADPGDSRVLEDYARVRRSDHEAVIHFTDGLIRIFSKAWQPVPAIRSAGLVALDHCPAAKHALARYAMGLSGHRPRLGQGAG